MSGADEPTGSAGASFTDLMTSLAVIFVLLTVAMMNRKVGAATQARAELVAALKGPLRQAGLPDSSVRDDSASVIIVFPDSALFARGRDTLLSVGKTLVQRLMPSLADTLCSERYRPKIETFVVEGHTDRTIPEGMNPENGRLYNLGLSQRRSMNFVQVTTQELLQADSGARANRAQVFNCIVQLTSATGRGQEQLLPVALDTAAAQRRVILRIRFKPGGDSSVVVASGGAPTARP